MTSSKIFSTADVGYKAARALQTARGIAGRAVTSEQLLAGARRLEIVHGTERYVLQLTTTGKLILTK